MSVDAASRTAGETLDDTLPQSEAHRQRTAELSRADGIPPGVAPGFDLIRSIGFGAFGSVWLAKERKTGRFAAVKFFSRRGHDWALLGREVEKLAALDSSHHIVGLIDVGWDAEPPYYVMEYLPNGSLAGQIANGPIAANDAVALARGVLRGLMHAHGSGILHCDLKPANVLLDQDFVPRLCDFGQARLSAEERPALGTLFYMAPEQADFKALPDVRWDVYALGALLYHMLTGRPPHRSPESEREIATHGSLGERLHAYRQIISREGSPTDHRKVAGVDRALAEIVERCLAPDPADRYPNAQAVLDAFESRERQRGRRPLVALGLIGPLLLLAAMTPFFLTTMRNAEATAKSNLVDRALESDALAASLLASNLTTQLYERTDELERVASDMHFRELVEKAETENWTDRSAIGSYLKKFRDASDARRDKLGLTRDTSWFLTDARGLQRWRDPFNKVTHDMDFSWKDYFHGLGVEFDADSGGDNPPRAELKPVRSPHISTVFRSDATGKYMVAITTPIFSSDDNRVIGLLGRTQHLWELLADYEQNTSLGMGKEMTTDQAAIEMRLMQSKQQLSLVDLRNMQLVAHPWMTLDHVKDLTETEISRLRISSDVAKAIERKLDQDSDDLNEVAARLSEYRDPVGQAGFAPRLYGGRWLAAAQPVVGTEWLVLVQERYDSAIAPAERMRSDLLVYAVAALAVGGGLIVMFWYFVTQALTERSTHPNSRDRTAAVDGKVVST
ncbi:MAG: protein kinase [Planctomycetota bacterium]|nr:protein kinase [Planctomycetaceae bacterium]MDQ3329660.1 protein kinase [Planctomycetota bacterium]